jgi:hypothetical protein
MSPTRPQAGGDHYQHLAIDPYEYCYRNKLGTLEGHVIKYVTRYQLKGGRKDLEKAITTLQRLIQMEYPDADPGEPAK